MAPAESWLRLSESEFLDTIELLFQNCQKRFDQILSQEAFKTLLLWTGELLRSSEAARSEFLKRELLSQVLGGQMKNQDYER